MKKLILAVMMLIPAVALANPGPYIQVLGGQNSIATDASWTYDSGTNTWNLSREHSNGPVGGVGAGYLWGNDTVDVGLELDALVYPDSTSASFTYDGDNISLLGVFRYKPFSRLGLVGFTKVGVTFVSQTLTYTNIRQAYSPYPVSGTAHLSATAPEVDLGIGYQFNQHWEVDLTANTVLLYSGDNTGDANFVQQANTAAQNTNTLLSVVYHFA